jgi:hypothetical protein
MFLRGRDIARILFGSSTVAIVSNIVCLLLLPEREMSITASATVVNTKFIGVQQSRFCPCRISMGTKSCYL